MTAKSIGEVEGMTYQKVLEIYNEIYPPLKNKHEANVNLTQKIRKEKDPNLGNGSLYEITIKYTDKIRDLQLTCNK